MLRRHSKSYRILNKPECNAKTSYILSEVGGVSKMPVKFTKHAQSQDAFSSLLISLPHRRLAVGHLDRDDSFLMQRPCQIVIKNGILASE